MVHLRKLHKNFLHERHQDLYPFENIWTLSCYAQYSPEAWIHFISLWAKAEHQNGTKHYRVSIGAENLRFNAKVYIVFLYIEGVYVLNIVDDATYFTTLQFAGPSCRSGAFVHLQSQRGLKSRGSLDAGSLKICILLGFVTVSLGTLLAWELNSFGKTFLLATVSC